MAAKAAFGVSLGVLVFGSGLGARFTDITALLRRPGLLVRSLIAVLVVAPVLAVVLVRVFDLNQEVAIALVALSVSPLPPLLPSRGEKAGGRTEYGLGLVLLLAVCGVPFIMVSTEALQAVFGRDYISAPWTIAKLLILTMVVPLVAGMVLARFSPLTARRLEGPIERVQRWLLPIAMVVLLISAAPDMWSLLGNHTLLALGIFVLGSFAAGHLLGGPDRRDAAVLAFATSCRHPATALALASANFPDTEEHAAVALYGLMTAAVGAVYTLWLRRHRAKAG
ncbi:bile acid:sodium symporter [Mycobacterium sp. NBC_00419]|uniref:bile acid:sodium symporter family protein n=1 Tax=Mycobacterium sp. NBC_00419 TaxID=2975989 RepID=UPI002E1C6783